MKKLLLMLALFAAVAAPAAAAGGDAVDQLPYSNDGGSSVFVSSAISPVAVVVSSQVPTRIDEALNAALLAGLGGRYKRYEVEVQNLTSTNTFVGYSVSLTTGSGWLLAPNERRVFKLGRAASVYAIAAPGSAVVGELRVGGTGWKP